MDAIETNSMKLTDRTLPPELSDLVELTGTFIEYWGFKAIEGKIWCLLFLSNHPLGSADLIQRLQVSKALISTSLKELQAYDVVREVARVGKRTLLYEANPNLVDVIFNVLRHRERRLMNRIYGAAQLLGRLPVADQRNLGISSVRVQTVRELVSTASGMLDALLSLQAINPAVLKRFQMGSSEEQVEGARAPENDSRMADDEAALAGRDVLSSVSGE